MVKMIYGHKDNNLYVNLFIPSTLRWGDTQIEQQTAFPDEEGVLLLFLRKRERKNLPFFSVFPNGRSRKHYACLLMVNGRT